MSKLGRKARKFAKKNLQSVLKRKRQLKTVYKRRAAKREGKGAVQDHEEDKIDQHNKRSNDGEHTEDVLLDDIFAEDDSDVIDDDSDSDGYLSEDSGCSDVPETEKDSNLEDNIRGRDMSIQNKEIRLELASKRQKLEKLKEEDPCFEEFLISYDNSLEQLRKEDNYSDEEEMSDDSMQSLNEDGSSSIKHKSFTSLAFNSWSKLAMEQHTVPALTKLLNGYRAACHYGSESFRDLDSGTCKGIQDSDTFCKVLIFMLQKADSIFRSILGISCNSCKKESVLELKNSSKWKAMKQLVKSYLRSTLFLLNQATDAEILAFSLMRLRASVIFFATFPHLLRRLIKIVVHLWATGQGSLSSHAFLIMKDVSLVYSSDYFDTCLIKAYKAYIGHSKFVEPALSKHVQFLRSSLVELCSQDVEKSYITAASSIQQLASIIKLGIATKKKDAVKQICSRQYTNCVDLWVTFISQNVQDNDLQSLLYMIIQIINGVARLFPGPRYLPLRLKCIQWLNQLSSSSGVFIPVASLVLDILEYKIGKESDKPGKVLEVSSSVKLPKHWLKSKNFQEACVFSAIELLAVHFSRWSYHISFPELATIPVIQLRKFLEITTNENFRRLVKRFLEQVELNIKFVQQKRDDASFSPKDQQLADAFLELEKCSSNAPFMQYYKSVMEKAASMNLIMNDKMSLLDQKQPNGKRERKQLSNNGSISAKRKVDAVKSSLRNSNKS